jgi:iron complex outermembrane receptor protein
VSNNFTSGNRFTDYTQYLKLSYDLDWATLLSITSHDDYFLKDRLDVDEGSSPVIDNRQPNGKFTYGQWTQEFRLVSPSDRPLRYTVGLYYADDEYTRRFSRGPFFSIANWYATSDSKQTAAFGQVDWDLRPDTTLTAGARYQHEKIDYTFLDHANGNAFFSGSGSESFGTYKVALDHHLTKDIMVYASWATGHKGQTFDLSTGFNLNRALAGPVRPETSNSYEVGARTSLLDHRLTFNITFFDAYYRNFQAQGIEVLPDGTTNFRLANVGRINNKGVEIDSNAVVGDWTFGFDGTYLDAEITDFPKAQCFPLQTAAQGCLGSPASQNLKGGTPPQSPKFKFAIPFSYQHPIGSSPFVGVFQGIYSYSSKFNFSLSQDPRTIQAAYGILNLSVGVRNPNDHYEIMAFVNNVTDEHYYANMFNSTTTYNSQTATQVLPPRDYRRYAGVRFAYTF